MSTYHDLRSMTQDFLMTLHQEVSKVWPFPIKEIEFIDESNGAFAYETDTAMQFNLSRIQIIVVANPRRFERGGLKSFLTALYAHELVGHYRVTPLLQKAHFLSHMIEDEQVPYHFQFAVLGNRDCIQALKSVPLYNLLLDILFTVRKKVNGKG